ncbi:hypothetical protein CAPTEDRAFT_201991 [Capitella teleta]|uniref:Uncharacterized protein n=1 Tax=Capitella teleta TaxID=283909 RepID=R7T9M6_CAPTE|nr:hypothetical protein CAPTEDRAFT_201991 [Capitella teleta]|eukprot:ELT90217.1 hypothetical protein CAPTEDRAFT_201991 [Capitella teleta]
MLRETRCGILCGQRRHDNTQQRRRPPRITRTTQRQHRSRIYGRTVDEINADYKCSTLNQIVFVFVMILAGIPLTVAGLAASQSRVLVVIGVFSIAIGLVVGILKTRQLEEQSGLTAQPACEPCTRVVVDELNPPVAHAPGSAVPTAPLDNVSDISADADDGEYNKPPTYDAAMEAVYDPPPDYTTAVRM